MAEFRPNLVKTAPDLVCRLKPDRLNALVQRLRRSDPGIIATGIENSGLIARSGPAG